MNQSQEREFFKIVKGYDAILLDAYGVLINESEPLPGAIEAIEYLQTQRKPFLILTNGSSRSLDETSQKYRELGLNIPADQIVSSGSIIPEFIKFKGWQGKHMAVLGTAASHNFVSEGGGIPVSPLETRNYEFVVIANQTTYPLLETLDEVISNIFERIDQGSNCTIILSNPDIIYPKAKNDVGITAGMIASILETALKTRYHRIPIEIHRLGKPSPYIFQHALKKLACSRVLMVGDQLKTDIAGANNVGIDSLLLKSGVFQGSESGEDFPEPTFILESL